MSGAVLGFVAARARLGLSRAAAVSGSVLSTALDGAPGGANSNPTNTGPGDAFVRRFSSIFGGHAQSTNEILMVSPTAFEYNSAAAQDNHFMEAVVEAERLSARETVLREHDALREMLQEVVGCKVHVFDHSEDHGTPDACFPNNWFSTHGGNEVEVSTLVTYPLKSENRRLERREDILSRILSGDAYGKVVAMESHERGGRYLEGTGALVLDRANRVAYAALSERCSRELCLEWAEALGYNEVVFFDATDEQGNPVYHTNVVMAVGTNVAVACTESVECPAQRGRLLGALSRNHEVVEITRGQMNAFCGNVLEVMDGSGRPCMVMSTQAHDAFTEAQREALRANLPGGLHHSPIDTLERIGGGGVRCTIAEIFRG